MDSKQMMATALVIAETVRELGEVPSGHLYAGLMGKVSYYEYERCLGILIHAGLISRSGHHLLTWAGPLIPAGVPATEATDTVLGQGRR